MMLKQLVKRSIATRTMFSRSLVTLPDLSYDYNELEPYISAKIMKLHHTKHHQAYIDNYNKFSQMYDDNANNLSIQNSLLPNLNFHSGGHINHSIFWTNLAPASTLGGGDPSDTLLHAINARFGTIDQFRTTFNNAAVAIQGSGWAWLVYNKESKISRYYHYFKSRYSER